MRQSSYYAGMPFSLPSRQTLALTRRFLGERVMRLLGLGTAVGLALFTIEIAFAYVLQSFFLSMGVAAVGSVRIPHWVPQGRLSIVTLALLVLGVARGLLYWAQQYLPHATVEESGYHQRKRILHWAFQSQTVSSAQTMNLFNELNNGTAFALMAVQNLVVATTSAILLGATLLYFSPLLTCMVGALLLMLAIPLRQMDQRVAESSNAIWSEWAKTYATLLASIKNLLLMHIYGTQDLEEAKAQLSLRNYRGHLLRHFSFASLKFALPQVFGVFAICLIAVTSGKFAAISSGLLISYFYILIRFVQSLALCAQHTSGLITYRVPFEQLMSWWKESGQIEAAEHLILPDAASRLTQAQAASEVIHSPVGWDLRRISFCYPGAETPVLDGLNLKVDPGTATVILGPSGAGKSTLLNLILGQIRPSQGEVAVHYNGREQALHEVHHTILSHIGYVGPESFLIEGTVRANLLYGLPFAPTPDEVERALDLAGCQFVRALSKGLEHPISEQGTGLSAGQKQRLSLARALLRRPRALILDEATSNLDTETELKLVKTLGELKGRMTLVAVTHRQPLLEIADQRFDL
jgi:ABC-type multidrug transport system fused ATPase/permease subunit